MTTRLEVDPRPLARALIDGYERVQLAVALEEDMKAALYAAKVQGLSDAVAALGWDVNGLGVRLSLRVLWSRNLATFGGRALREGAREQIETELVEEWMENVRGE